MNSRLDPDVYWSSALPDFDRPPVVETVLAVHLAPVRQLDSIRTAEFWSSRLREEFPIAEEQERHFAPLESFEIGPSATPRLEFRRGPQAPRFWFRSAAEDQLVQVQNDWIAFNWRKSQSASGYRHFTEGLDRFSDLFTSLSSYVETLGARPLEALQVEVSYVNQILAADGGWAQPSEMPKVFRGVQPLESRHLPAAESHGVALQYVARDRDGLAFGRLYVSVEPALDPSGPAFIMTLTFKARPRGTDLPSVKDVLEIGHRWVVGSFDELTTADMHQVWGRRDRT